MSKQKTIIHLLPDFYYRPDRSSWVSRITTDIDDRYLHYPTIVLGDVYHEIAARIERRKIIKTFKSIGITDGSEVYIVTASCPLGQEVYAYGSTTQEKWVLTDRWIIVDTSDDRIQQKL